MYGEEELDKILRDINALSNLYANSIDIKNQPTVDVESRNICRAIEKYMKKLVLSSNMKNDERLENYRNVLLSTLKKDNTYIYESEFLNLPKERLLGIMTEDTYNQFSSYKSTVKDYCNSIYNKILKKEEVTQNERHILIDFLNSNIGTKDSEIYKMQETMIKSIINNEIECDFYDASFFVSYISNEEAKEYGHEVVSNIVIFTGENKNARGYASQYRVNINAEYAVKSLNSDNKEDLADLLHTICHEVAHTKQNKDIQTNICNKDTVDILTDKIFRKELSKDEFKYYISNYYFESGEKNAEKTGFINAKKYIDKYLDNAKEKTIDFLDNKKDHELYVDMISMRKDSTGEKVDADKFKIEKMEEVLKRNNSYLSKFPQYKQLYNNNGELKSFSERLISYTDFKKQNNEDSNDLFLSSFNYSLDNNDLNTIDFSSMSKDDLFKTIHALSELYNTYSSMSHNALESVRENEKFLNGERDIKDSNYYRDNKIRLMSSRYQKLEKVLDVFYERFGEEYKKVEAYSYDQYIYDKDKEYVRHKFSKIKYEREKSRQRELEKMMQDNNQTLLTSVNEISKLKN